MTLMIVEVSQHTNEKDIKSIENIIPDQEIEVKKCLFIYSKHKCCTTSIVTSIHTHHQCDLRLEMEAPDEKSTKIRSLATSMLCTYCFSCQLHSLTNSYSDFIAATAAALGETDEDMMKMKMSMSSMLCLTLIVSIDENTLSLTLIWTFPIEKGHK